MHEFLIVLGSLLSCIIAYVTINKFLFYTKSEVDSQIKDLRKELDDEDASLLDKLDKIHIEIKEELASNKEQVYEKLLDSERSNNKMVQEIYDRLNQNKQIFDEYNKKMLEAISQLKTEEKETTTQMIQMVNTVKDELRNDYINRYNELMKLIGTKANVDDFNRLENKFDKVTETITQLKTIIQMQMDQDKR